MNTVNGCFCHGKSSSQLEKSDFQSQDTEVREPSQRPAAPQGAADQGHRVEWNPRAGVELSGQVLASVNQEFHLNTTIKKQLQKAHKESTLKAKK